MSDGGRWWMVGGWWGRDDGGWKDIGRGGWKNRCGGGIMDGGEWVWMGTVRMGWRERGVQVGEGRMGGEVRNVLLWPCKLLNFTEVRVKGEDIFKEVSS